MTKYNNKKVTIDNIKFDSKAESQYYMHLQQRIRDNEILGFKLQPKYKLQESFRKNGKLYRAIDYVADFEIEHLDGSIEVIDVKGLALPIFNLKEKLYHKRYQHKLSVVTFSKIDGGWIEMDELKKNRKTRKRRKTT
ncbi:MAG: DUF1064 domain-containing protein [Bacilli bacterium]